MSGPNSTAVTYGFVRARQLEGTVHLPPSLGTWPITGSRGLKLYGFPIGAAENAIPNSVYWPPQIPTELDQIAKKHRVPYYQRVVTLSDFRDLMKIGLSVNSAFEITDAWYDAPGGMIPAPRPDDVISGSHTIVLESYDAERSLFKFWNGMWGANWGDGGGYGYLPYDYLKSRLVDSYCFDFRPSQFDKSGHRGIVELNWGRHSLVGHIPVHVCEWYDINNDENIGWAFAFERDGRLDVEELFVNPAYRERGYGRKLLNSLVKLSKKVGLPLRFWIPFADVESHNLPRIVGMLKRIGYRLSVSENRWSAYEGTPRLKGQSFQVPPLPYVPSRPAESLKKAARTLVASTAILSATANDVMSLPSNTNSISYQHQTADLQVMGESGIADYQEIVDHTQRNQFDSSLGRLVIGSLEYDRKNERRFALIQKRNRGGLTEEEEAEFQSLQKLILGVTKVAFPHPPM